MLRRASWLAVCLCAPIVAQGGWLQGVPADAGGGSERSVIPVPTDGTWFVLDELMAPGSFYSPIFSYSSLQPVQLDVTDLFVVSDRNEAYLNGGLLGATPAMPDWNALFPPVGPLDDPPYTTDPGVAWGRAEFSKQSFVLPAGNHLLTFRNIHIPPTPGGGPFSDGTIAFRIVPEPAGGALLVLAGAALLRRRRMARAAAVFAAVAVLASTATAGAPCGLLTAGIVGNALEIEGGAGPDSIRIALDATNPAVVEVYSPATAGAPSCTFDSVATPFDTIRVLTYGDDDLVVVDDAYGNVSDGWRIEIDGGDGSDVVLAGIDLNTTSLSSALAMLTTLDQARNLLDDVLDLLDQSGSGCSTVPCLVTNAADAIRVAGEDLIIPTAHYVRDIEGELVQPTAAAVRDAHDRIGNYLQTFIATDAQGVAVDAQMFTADVEVRVGDFELLLPIAQDLLSRAQVLYARASTMGLETQGGDALTLFQQTIASHISTIVDLAENCPEDPEPAETQFDEDLQDPSGLPGLCAEVERRIESLEALVDSVEGEIDGVEAEGDALEADGDALEQRADAIGDDEDSNSHAAQIAAQGDALVVTGDALSATADLINADWEQWVAQVEADLEARGDTMHTRGNTDVLAAADALELQVQADVESAAAALLADAEQIAADLDALMIVAAPLLRDDLSLRGGGGCEVNATHTITGGGGSDFLVGTTGSDVLHGGAGNDLLIGAGGADELHGDEDNDLIFGGGGADEIRGGENFDILVGNAGDDCIYGGGGQTLSRGSLSVDLGDLFFGVAGNDLIVAGDSEDDDPTEIDVAFGGEDDDRIRVSHGGDLTIGSFTIRLGNLAFGGSGEDDILAKDGIDVLFGGDDDDVMASGKGAVLQIGSGSGALRLALGDLLFGGAGDDTQNTDDPDADRADDDIDVAFGGGGADTIHGFGGGALTVGDPNDPTFEFRFGNLIFGGDENDAIDTLDGIDVIFGGENDDTISTAKGFLLELGDPNDGFRLALGDLIFGRAGADEIDSDDPNGDRAEDEIDVIFGGDGDDTIRAYGGGLLSIGDPNEPDFELRIGNVVFGGDGDDRITTLDGIDLIFGGAQDDHVEAGLGDVLDIDDAFRIDLGDLIFGQDGDDVLHADAPDPGDGEPDDGIDLIFCGPGNDRAYGATGGRIELPEQDFCLIFGNLMFGGPGNDTLRGDYENWDPNDPRPGIDLIFGADGEDTIEGAAGSLIVIGDITSGQAIVIGFGNLLFGGLDDDVIRGADDAEFCSGVSDDLDDLLSDLGITDLAGAADLIFCSGGNDDVDAYNGIDFVFGSDGEDNLRADHGGLIVVPISGVPTPIAFGNLMFGGEDDDVIRSLGRLTAPAVPPLEIDLLFGGPCDDDISAGDGLNLVFGNKADDTIVAGDGVNLAFGNAGADSLSLGDGLNLGFGNRDNDVVTAMDGVNLLFGNRGDDLVAGGDGLNLVFGNRESDTVSGGDGVNLLFGNSGPDSVAGGAGLTLAFGNRSNDSVQAGSGLAVLFGNQGNDNVAGGAGLCVAFGNADHDLVSAGNGLAVLFGNRGEDRLTSGSGLSVLFGNRDGDIVSSGGAGLFVAFGNAESDVIVGGGGLNLLFGNANDDQFFGGGGVNIAFGNRENDILRGGGSADFLFGNTGADRIAGAAAADFVFGNRDDDAIVSDGGNDFIFGNRGNDTLRSGGDGSTRDYLFGNRGNDDMFGCSNSDRLYGGRGNDNKDRNECNGISLAAPARGEVRGVVRIDLDGDGIGDIPHAGVTVMAGSSSSVTDADGNYRIAGLAVGGHTVSQVVPGGYSQVAPAGSHAITVGSMGIDLFLGRDFVNQENCYVSPDAWACLGNNCDSAGPGYECLPVLVRKVLRCSATGEICVDADSCPCGECEPSWAVEECACVNPLTDCYVILTSAGPICSMECLDGGTAQPCNLVVDGDLCYCACPPPPCTTELAQFTFGGLVTSLTGDPPPHPWSNVQVGDPWTLTYWFSRYQPDQDGGPAFGDYPAIVFYQLNVGAAGSGGSVTSSSTLIRNVNGQGIAPDGYEVTIPLIDGAPPPECTIRMLDVSGTAWTLAGLMPRDALPLCGDVVLERFARRVFQLSVLLPGASWQINGSVLTHECDNCAGPFPIISPEPDGVIAAPAPAQGAAAPARRMQP